MVSSRRVVVRPHATMEFKALETIFGAGAVTHHTQHNTYIVQYADRKIAFDVRGRHIATGTYIQEDMDSYYTPSFLHHRLDIDDKLVQLYSLLGI